MSLPQFDRSRHGSLFDRGSADAWYRRAFNPHWYPDGTGRGDRITDLSLEEKDEYAAGYQWQIDLGDFKEY